MPEPDLQQIVGDAIRDVMETMFFAGVLGEAPQDAEECGDWVAAVVEFRGMPSGALALRISSAAAAAAASNFLGAAEADAPPDRVREVVCELANMVCGSILSRFESDVAFDLRPPRVIEPGGQPDPGVPRAAAVSCVYELEEGFLSASLALEAQP